MAIAQYLPGEAEDVQEYQVSTGPVTHADMLTESLISALNDVSGTASVSIHRQNGNGKEALTFLDSFAPDKFTPEDLLQYIKNTYGSGDYRIHIRENGKLKANRHVSIEAPRIVPRETQGNSDLRELVAVIQQQQQQMLAVFREMQNPQNTEDQMIERMLKYKALFGGNQQSRGFGEIIETVNGLKMLGINVGGIQTEPQEKEEGFGDILEKMAPIVTAMVQSSANNPQPQQQPVYKPNPQPRQNPMQLALKLGIAALLKAARNKADTAFYADVVMDQLPEDKIGLLLTPDALAQLESLEPKVKEHREWFADVIEHIKGMNGAPSKYADLYAEQLTQNAGEDIKGEVN
jgi:hypothetical protein